MRVRLTELVGEELVTLKRAGGWDVKKSEIIVSMCQAVRETAELYGESEEAAAYARHITTKLERILSPRWTYRLAQTSPT
jgi:hypothetical protein